MPSNYEAVKRYYAENCIEFKLRALKTDGQRIRDYAAANGVSIQSLFLAAVADYMDSGKVPEPVKRGPKSSKPIGGDAE